MKKSILILIIIAFIGGAAFTIYRSATKIKGYTRISSYNDIDVDKGLTMVTMGSETCPHCTNFKEVLNAVAVEKQINLYYLDVNNIDNAHNYDIPIKCADTTDQKLLDGFGTPLTLFFKDGKIIDCISGEITDVALKSRLRNVGMIK